MPDFFLGRRLRLREELFRGRAFAEEQVDDGEVRDEGEAVGKDLFVHAGGGAFFGPERLEGGAQVAVVCAGLDVGVAEAERRRSAEYSGDALQQGEADRMDIQCWCCQRLE